MREALLAKWRGRLVDESPDDCTDRATRSPGSYRVVLHTRRRGTAAGTPSVPAASHAQDLSFDDPADFVAWLRVVGLPRALRVLCGPPESCVPFPPAEACLPAAGELRLPAEAALLAADAALSRPRVTAADAEAVIAAYNALAASADAGVALELESPGPRTPDGPPPSHVC